MFARELLENDSIKKFFQIDDVNNIPEETIGLISLLEVCEYKDGDNIVTYGADPDDGMYIIAKGKATVYSGEGKIINFLAEGSFVGELALMSGKKRSATVTAKGDLVAVRMSRKMFDEKIKSDTKYISAFMEILYANLTDIIGRQQKAKAELDVATKIQASVLPHNFDDFPVEVYATMKPAREVGGDFYDIFNIDETHIGFVMADVSGKGITAALFMIMAKNIIKNYAKLRVPVDEVLKRANDELCSENEAEMFVTVFMGVLDLETLEFTFVNAGHNAPIFYNTGLNRFEYLKVRPDFVIAGMEGISFTPHNIKLEKGSIMYMYTDGVTEAQNRRDELFSDERLIYLFNENGYEEMSVKEILETLGKEITKFVDGNVQSDDITMLGFKI